MARTLLLIPLNENVGLNSISIGLAKSIEQKGVKLGFMIPVLNDSIYGDSNQLISLLRSETIETGKSISTTDAENLIAHNKKDILLEGIISSYQQLINNDIVLVQGVAYTSILNASSLNYDLAKALNAEVIFLSSPERNETIPQLKGRLEALINEFDKNKSLDILGLILNKINAPNDELERSPELVSGIIESQEFDIEELFQEFSSSTLKLVSAIKWNSNLLAIQTSDLAKYLDAEIINAGEINSRRITSLTFCSRSVEHVLSHFKAGSLLVTTADRPEILLAASLAAVNGMKIGGVLLTGNYTLSSQVKKICEHAFTTGLPVLSVKLNTWQTAVKLHNIDLQISNKDVELIKLVTQYISENLDRTFVDSIVNSTQRSIRLSPPAFRYQLTELAIAAHKTIVLPEGDEPRTIKAAILAAERKIAKCILLASKQSVDKVLLAQNLVLPSEGVEIVDPDEIRETYVDKLVELRKNKGMTPTMARDQLGDNVVLGTMMLESGVVDGLVSGAIHTTANTIRPALQIIKTAPQSSLVSSIFFMLLPEQVLVYGDCAINPDPSAHQLAEIAIQSADSAKSFGIEPKIAMISYSTGTSGKGSDVDKVIEATKIAKEKRPDLIIDGPLQYDAAIMRDVAKTKAPNSPVAGQATVFIFPDLNTGNTTYKAVQRSANLISIGPMLQGMRKPVNDLSRGALVDDIIYTIALTAIQAMNSLSD